MTVAFAPSAPAAQSDSDVEIVTVKVSSPSTRSSDAIGIVSVAVKAPSSTVIEDGVAPVSSALAVPAE